MNDYENSEPNLYCEPYFFEKENIEIDEYTVFPDKLGKTSYHSIRFNHNDQYVAAGTRDGTVRIYNLMTNSFTCELNCNLDISKPGTVQSLRWRPKIEGRTNNILMTASKDQLIEWHTPSRKIVSRITVPDIIECVEYSDDGSLIAVGCTSSFIMIYDALTKKELLKLGGVDSKVTGHSNKVKALKFSKSEPRTLISAGDSSLLFWDLNNPENQPKALSKPAIAGDGLDMNCFGEILTASWRKDEPLQLWDYESRKLRKNIDWNFRERAENVKESTHLYCCRFSKDYGKLIFAGGSILNSVKVFDWNGRPVASFEKLSHEITCLDTSNDVITKNYQLFAFAGGEGAIRIYKIKYINPEYF